MIKMNYIPTYLNDYCKPITSLNEFNENDWFKKLSCKIKIFYKESDIFRIITNGIIYEDGFISGNNESALKIYAESIIDGFQIKLFDEETDGYGPLLIETIEFNNKDSKESIYRDPAGEELFNVYFWTNSSIDFYDEFEFNEKNELELLNGDYMDINLLRKNAFDAFGIILKNKNGMYTKLTEIELA